MITSKECYISVDVEASGPIPGDYSMLSLGACLVGNPSEQFYVEFQPISEMAVPQAMEVSGLSIEKLRTTGTSPKEGMENFSAWVADSSNSKKPVFVAFNGSFDWAFVNWYFHRYLAVNPFGIGGVDIKAYYMGLVGCEWSNTSSSNLPKHLSLEHEKKHNALADAVAQANLFQKLLEMNERNGAR